MREQTLKELIEKSPNSTVLDAWVKLYNKLQQFKHPVCAISGGSDSDLVLHMCATLDHAKKIKYVFFDTGLEFMATKRHVEALEKKYGITVEKHRAKKPVPACVREFGVPFLNKRVSDYIERLQRYNFQWEDLPFDTLYAKYPKCKAALRWWCNEFGEGSHFNISNNLYLKEFMVLNPPTFRISNKCCLYAKKETAKECIENADGDLNIFGIRKAEGGARATAYKSCFSPENEKHVAEYRPIFWFDNDCKEAFTRQYGIEHSDCYRLWNLPRTGCSGCPLAWNFEAELEATKRYEPKLYKALTNVFGDAYQYTREYRKFQKEMGVIQKGASTIGNKEYKQITWDEYEEENR